MRAEALLALVIEAKLVVAEARLNDSRHCLSPRQHQPLLVTRTPVETDAAAANSRGFEESQCCAPQPAGQLTWKPSDFLLCTM